MPRNHPQAQDPQAAASMIDAIASRQMGGAPAAQEQGGGQASPQDAERAQAQAAAAQQGAPQGQQGQKVKTKQEAGENTAEDTASETGSPETEGDRMRDDAILYEVAFDQEGKDVRKLTPQQIKSTFERYSALNYENAQYKPVRSLIQKIQQANPGAKPEQIANYLESMIKAQKSNPTMGNREGKQPGDGVPGSGMTPHTGQPANTPEELEAQLSKWEEENAAALPPGYKEMMMGQSQGGQTVQQLQRQVAQMGQMLQQVLAQSQGVADAARSGMQQGQQTQSEAIKRQIGNNLDRVQQHLGLPDESANDFMVFAGERGFTLEDFIDPQMALRVMTDFKNQQSSPEMERMREMAKRRQAYTGSLGSTPSAGEAAMGGGGPAGGEGDPFDRLSQSIMAQKGIG